MEGNGTPVANAMYYLRAFFGFYGRMNRSQYAMVMLVGYVGPLIIFALTWPSLRSMGDLGTFTGLTPLIVMIWVILAATAKRFHDINKSGFASLLICIPIVGIFTPLVYFYIQVMPRTTDSGPLAFVELVLKRLFVSPGATFSYVSFKLATNKWTRRIYEYTRRSLAMGAEI